MVRAWPLVGWEASSPDKGEGQKLGEGVRGWGVTREIYCLCLVAFMESGSLGEKAERACELCPGA